VRDFLVSQGVTASRIETVSYGKERPIAEGADESAWSQNRNARTNFQGQGGL
jgi:peptidoglycan-associated lipoprotein